jgi:hypothetical protein
MAFPSDMNLENGINPHFGYFLGKWKVNQKFEQSYLEFNLEVSLKDINK